jgi:hypothetical protein
MGEAQVDACAGASAQGPFMKQQVAAIGLGRIERAAEADALAPLSPHAVIPQQIEGCTGKKRWGQRPGPMGNAEPSQHHAGHGCARRPHVLLSGYQAGVHPVDYAYIVADRRDDAEVVEAFHVTLPCSTSMASSRQRRINGLARYRFQGADRGRSPQEGATSPGGWCSLAS